MILLGMLIMLFILVPGYRMTSLAVVLCIALGFALGWLFWVG